MGKLRAVLLVLVPVFLAFGLGGSALAATAVNLGTANSFAVLGGSTITNTGSTVVNGDLGLSPGTSVTGFPPGTVNGTQHVTDPTAAQAEADLVAAYNAAGTQTGAAAVSGDLGGMTLTPGVYNSASSLGLTGTLTLDGQGNPDAVFIFQIGSALTTASGSRVNLVNGAQACNVFWQVVSSATLGTNSNFSGSILALTSVTATTGAIINGRLLARNGAVTLDVNAVTKPSCAASAVTPSPTPSLAMSAPPTTPALLLPPTTAAGPNTAASPKFPNTGIPPKDSAAPWNVIIPGAIFVALFSAYLARKKRAI